MVVFCLAPRQLLLVQSEARSSLCKDKRHPTLKDKYILQSRQTLHTNFLELVQDRRRTAVEDPQIA